MKKLVLTFAISILSNAVFAQSSSKLQICELSYENTVYSTQLLSTIKFGTGTHISGVSEASMTMLCLKNGSVLKLNNRAEEDLCIKDATVIEFHAEKTWSEDGKINTDKATTILMSNSFKLVNSEETLTKNLFATVDEGAPLSTSFSVDNTQFNILCERN